MYCGVLVTASIVMNVGLIVRLPGANWKLPHQLVFYVFQALTYTIDLYRRDAKGTRSYLAHLSCGFVFPDHAGRTDHARLHA